MSDLEEPSRQAGEDKSSPAPPAQQRGGDGASRKYSDLVRQLERKVAEAQRAQAVLERKVAGLRATRGDLARQNEELRASRFGIQRERERAEAASAITEGKYRSLFDAIDEGFCIIQMLFAQDGKAIDYRFLEVNAAFEKHTGLAGAQGKRVLELVPNLDAQWFEIYAAVALTRRPRRFATHGEALNRFFDVYAFPVGEPGEHKVALLFRDETERKRAQDLLAEKEEQLRKLADNLPDSAVYQYVREPHSAIGRFTYLSGGIEKITGVKVEDALANPGALHGLIPPEQLERLMREEERCMRELADFQIEVPMRLGNGALRWMSIRSRPRPLPNGSVTWDGVQTDITERRRADDAVERARDRFELLSKTIGRLLAAPDPQSVVQELCDDVRKFLGCDVFFNFLLDDHSQRLRYNACGGVDPRLARKVEALELGQSLCGTAARDACRVHAQQLGATDDPRSALVRSIGIRAYACHPLMGPRNQVIGTLSFGASDRDSFSPEDLELMRAVTDHVAIAMLRRQSDSARTQAEERLRTVLGAVGVGLWSHELQSRRITWDARTRELFFITPGEEPTLELFWRRLHPDDRAPVRQATERAWRENRTFAMDHRVVDPKTGRIRWIRAEGRGMRDQDGTPVCFEGISYDISDRREFQAELQRLVEERTVRLQELVGELEHFSYTITHDLKAPLRAMKGFAQVAAEVCGPGEARPFLDKISSAAERMDMLIRDALNYSQAVRSELPLEDVDTGPLVHGILDSYPQFHPVKAHIRVEDPLPVVLGNAAGLTQCFSNLLGNAVKFVKPGQIPEIRVWAEALPNHDGWVRFWVEDKGIGIPAALFPRLFDMFSRGNKGYEGTGIGLALVRKVVQRMGGRVGVESQEGKGSCFWVELKLGHTASDSPTKPVDLRKTQQLHPSKSA